MIVADAIKELGQSVKSTFAGSSFGCKTFAYGISETDQESVPLEQLPRVELLQVSMQVEEQSTCTIHWRASIQINARRQDARPSGAWADKSLDNTFAELVLTAIRDWQTKVSTGAYLVDADVDANQVTWELFDTEAQFGASATFDIRVQERKAS
jgi:hypothetical protein